MREFSWVFLHGGRSNFKFKGALTNANRFEKNHASVPACQKYTQQWSAFKESIGSCNKLALNATIELPICYNTNYIDGPTFVWDRTGECSGSAPTNVNNNSPVPRDPCFAGLTISMPRLDGGKITNTSFPLFQGIHVLNLVQYSKQDVLEFMTPNSVQVATDSVITKQNLCCNMGPSNINASCDTTSPTSNGIYANDRITFANNSISVTSGQFYQVKIRTGPSYTKIEAKRVPLPLALIAAAGSINSIFLSTCTLVLLAWRFMDFEKRKQTRFTGPAANFGAVAISTVQKPSIAVPSPIKSYEMA